MLTLRLSLANALLRVVLWLQNPAPKPSDGPAVWDLVIADTERLLPNTPARRRLLADMRGRDDLGLARYGTRLQVGNGRSALLDSYYEDLDACVYRRLAIEKATSPGVKRRLQRNYEVRLRLALGAAIEISREEAA